MGAVLINKPVLQGRDSAEAKGPWPEASACGGARSAGFTLLDALDKAIEQFRLDMNRLPSTEEGLAALNVAPANEPNWAGPYLKKDVPRDPWGHPYVYLAPGTHNNDFDLMSYGKDGQPGGSGENADIGNW
jgi:general secretion pathway protein G